MQAPVFRNICFFDLHFCYEVIRFEIITYLIPSIWVPNIIQIIYKIIWTLTFLYHLLSYYFISVFFIYHLEVSYCSFTNLSAFFLYAYCGFSCVFVFSVRFELLSTGWILPWLGSLQICSHTEGSQTACSPC